MTMLPSLGHRGEGWVALQIIALGGVAIGGTLFAGPRSSAIDAAAFAAGVLAMLGGAALATIAVMGLRRREAFTVVPLPRAEAELVETGPYRWIRHPIYAGVILGALGWSVARLSWPAVVATLVLAGA